MANANSWMDSRESCYILCILMGLLQMWWRMSHTWWRTLLRGSRRSWVQPGTMVCHLSLFFSLVISIVCQEHFVLCLISSPFQNWPDCMCCLKQCTVGVFLLLWTYFHFCLCVPVQNASVLMLSSINLSPSFPVSFKLALVCTSVLLLWPGSHRIKCSFSLKWPVLFCFKTVGKLDELHDLNFCSITKGHTF